jgi:hypothetical protein
MNLRPSTDNSALTSPWEPSATPSAIRGRKLPDFVDG